MTKIETRLMHPINPFRTCIIGFLFFFAVTTLINLTFINMPPVWDAAAGTFAPAIYLFENNFDFAGLLKQDGFFTGGPNVHSITIISFLTYFILSLSNGNPELFLPLLHLMQFAFTGIVLTGTFFMALRLVGIFAACVISFAVLFYPLFLVQTGYLYLEIPGTAFLIAGVFAWASRCYITAIVLATAACLIKSFGMVLIFSLVILLLLEPSLPKRRKIMFSGLLIFLMVGIEMIKWGSAKGMSFDRSQYFSYLLSIFFKLNVLPDLKILITTALLLPIYIRMRQVAYSQTTMFDFLSKSIAGDLTQRLVVMIYLLPLVYMGFIITVPLAGMNYTQLPRYYVWILPFLFVGAVYGCKLFLDGIFKHESKAFIQKSELLLTALLMALTCFFIANRVGRYYPSLGDDTNSFSSTERSYEYLEFYKIQRNSVISLAELQKGLPAFVTRGEYYYLSSPLMGYVKKELNNIFLIVNEPYNSSNLNDYPDEFVLLDVSTQPLHGGKVVRGILNYAQADPRYSVFELVRHHRGPYTSSLYRISRKIELAVPH